MQRITLAKRVRSFEKVGQGSLVGRTGYCFETGSTLNIGNAERVVYDHRDHVAIPVYFNGRTLYLLIDEMGGLDLLPLNANIQ